MSDYEQSEIIHASPDMVFEFVSDVRNLPKYLPTVDRAEPQGPDRVSLHGKANGREYTSDGHFHADRNAKRIEWGSDGENRYSGALQVTPSGGGSQVTVHIVYAPRPDQAAQFIAQSGDKDAAVNEGIRVALESIRNICEGAGGKVESRAA
jgi:carbon monoxide dehydrogenase subunit G